MCRCNECATESSISQEGKHSMPKMILQISVFFCSFLLQTMFHPTSFVIATNTFLVWLIIIHTMHFFKVYSYSLLKQDLLNYIVEGLHSIRNSMAC